MIRPDEIILRRATIDELIDLRHRVLRAGLPRSEALFPGDEAAQTRHFGAFHRELAVVAASFHLNNFEGEPAWQLRGMATEAAFRGRGWGGRLMVFAEKALLETSAIPLLWCNARTPAVRFYQGQGWKIVSEEFEIPTAGPHFRMLKRLVKLQPGDR